jgi:arylsulfatase
MRTRTTQAVAAVLAAGALLGWLAASGRLALAQDKPGQPNGVPQPPVGGDVLPKPPQPFRGTINLRAKDSKPDFPQPVKAPAGAPNVLLVLLDDCGFGADQHIRRPV